MRLERLEINGFKSFSDRSELAFDKGVTAIVGPNGCGKSNVADAITWVMGEQSAKSLRGERMEDVIFSGSDARKPTASAEVRLRLSGVLRTLVGPAFEGRARNSHTNGHAAEVGDVATVAAERNGADGYHASEPGEALNGHALIGGNGHANGHAAAPGLADADELIRSVAREVEVTRRLYRSGESEYLIDGRVCRLKDVHELLMDTGLGAKAYAIIEQGKIGLILSSRPTDRRQLIEEAAGITKYRSRRRAAELKLEAAQQNLTRIDDIVFELEKQRGALKRQAAKTRRYKKLRDEMRRWEKRLFARKYRELSESIESARNRLAEARERETAAASGVAEADATLSRTRIELLEAEARASAKREAAHARELEVNRGQQQIAFDRAQVESLSMRMAVVASELESLASRREPSRLALIGRQAAVHDADAERDRAAGVLAAETAAAAAAHREIEGLEADVEAARSEVFSAINAATALRHSLEHAAAARERVIEGVARLQTETEDLRIERERMTSEHTSGGEQLRAAQAALEETRLARVARESELASARIEQEWRARAVRAQEHELAALQARLTSLEEMEAGRAEYGDATRTLLALANGRVNQRGAVADYLEVETGYERAVEACLGEVLQYVVVEQPAHAVAGLEVVREQGTGRCGFLIARSDEGARAPHDRADIRPFAPDLTPLAAVMRVTGPFADAIVQAVGDAWIADSIEAAAAASRRLNGRVATPTGELFVGAHLVSGGKPQEARGILETRRAIRELRERLDHDRETLTQLQDEVRTFDQAIAASSAAITALLAEQHRYEKTIVGCEAVVKRGEEEQIRLDRKQEQLDRERQQLHEERDALDRRQEEARASIVRLEEGQRAAEATLNTAQRRLFEARETAQDLTRRAAEAGAVHATLVERTLALAADVQRLEEAGVELEARVTSLSGEQRSIESRLGDLGASILATESQVNADVHALGMLRDELQAEDAEVVDRRGRTEALEADVRAARGTLESARSRVAELDVARATAEAELAHLGQSCLDVVQMALDDVLAEVSAAGESWEDDPTFSTEGLLGEDETEELSDGEGEAAEGEAPRDVTDEALIRAQQRTLSAEDAIAALRAKIERLGPVNMMAIEQFDELETRHAFLSGQRKDLVDSIAQTVEAIKRIDVTTRQRFAEAFAAINLNFQETFATLFGGGRAGLALLDENDPLESGIEIIAQPPGKRLQSVQLLSGGEKALTAIALMFALFKHKPSPFCLLDEIDAPLDDANIGRFVEMLRGMQAHTQFILITHNRKTMEIADRLYGVTMEEPGVSKLISVQFH